MCIACKSWTFLLLQVITDTANSYVKQNIPCLEHCLKKLSKGLESFMVRQLCSVQSHLVMCVVAITLSA